MKNILWLLFFIAVSYQATAQITYIPDQGFEQTLIYLGVDSDGLINGQVLTSDIEGVTELVIDGGSVPYIYDLTGIQDFISLEKLVINFTEITQLDVSQNFQLKKLDCSSNMLTSIDVSSNTLLEILRLGNIGGDLGPWNEITEIDLSNNSMIHTLQAIDMGLYLKKINLKNGNNNPQIIVDIGVYPWVDWDDPDYDPNEIYGNVCVEVDDVEAAQNGEYPYSEWTIHHSHITYSYTDDLEACVLNVTSFEADKISVYPNPVSDILYFESDNPVIDKIILFDLTGRKVLEQNQGNSIFIAHLQRGNYILKIFSDKGVQTEKIIIK